MGVVQNWIMKLAGIMVLYSVCEIIMPSGEMKKYVRSVAGLVLVISVISPLAKLTDADISAVFPARHETAHSAELYEGMEAREREEVMRLYREKLCESMKAELEKGGADCVFKVDAEVCRDDGEDFGQIESVEVTAKGGRADLDLICRILKSEFGVSADKVVAVFVENAKE